MTLNPRAAPLRYGIGIAALIVFIGLLVGLLLFNFNSGIAVIAGVLIAAAVIALVGWITRRSKKLIWLLLAAVLVLGLGSVVCLSIIVFQPHHMSQYPNIICPIASYRIVAVPDSSQLKGFQIEEYVTLVDGVEYKPSETWVPAMVDGRPGYRLPAQPVVVTSRGFLLKEALIASSVTCCESALVEIKDIPLDAFYAAVYARDLQHYPYVDTETITWDPGSDDIRFSYIVPPFQILRPVFAPLMGASSLSQWLLGLIALLGTFVFTPVVRPILEEFAQKWLKNKLHLGDEPVRT
jgi:hypothetical protein